MEMEQKTIIQYIYLFLFICLILILSFTVVYLIKNAELIKAEPIKFGMNQYKFTKCSCYLSNGELVSFGDNQINILNFTG